MKHIQMASWVWAALVFSGCSCFVPVGEDAGARLDAGEFRCRIAPTHPPNQRFDLDDNPNRTGAERYVWSSTVATNGCATYAADVTLGITNDVPTSWGVYPVVRLCNACSNPIYVRYYYYGTYEPGFVDPKVYDPIPSASVQSSVELAVGLRDSDGVTVPSHCVAENDVGCFLLPPSPSPDFATRTQEILPGETLLFDGPVLRGFLNEGTNPPELEAPFAPFEDFRGYMYSNRKPTKPLDLDGKLDLVVFVPVPLAESALQFGRPSRPRDQICALAGFPLVAPECVHRLDAGGYSKDDLIELVIPEIQLPAPLLLELKARAARPLPDGGS
jgi:hypothetical protein